MYINKETDYALRALIVLTSSTEGLADKDISKNYKIPHNFLSLILPKLMRAGLISMSHTDKKKVYVATASAQSASVLQVIEAINGKLDLIAFNPLHKEDAQFFPKLDAMWGNTTEVIEGHLARILMKELG